MKNIITNFDLGQKLEYLGSDLYLWTKNKVYEVSYVSEDKTWVKVSSDLEGYNPPLKSFRHWSIL